jgi:hypothetical protein
LAVYYRNNEKLKQMIEVTATKFKENTKVTENKSNNLKLSPNLSQ